MEQYLNIVVKAVFVENLALAYFLGMCTFLAVSKSVKTSMGLGAGVIVVQSITVPMNNLIYHHLLKPGSEVLLPRVSELDLTFLGLIIYIGVIASMVQILEMVLDRFVPALYNALGIYLPLRRSTAPSWAVRCSWSTAASSSGRAWPSASERAWASPWPRRAGRARERMAYSDPPAGLRGIGMAFLTTGLMALAFMAFTGISL